VKPTGGIKLSEEKYSADNTVNTGNRRILPICGHWCIKRGPTEKKEAIRNARKNAGYEIQRGARAEDHRRAGLVTLGT